MEQDIRSDSPEAPGSPHAGFSTDYKGGRGFKPFSQVRDTDSFLHTDTAISTQRHLGSRWVGEDRHMRWCHILGPSLALILEEPHREG